MHKNSLFTKIIYGSNHWRKLGFTLAEVLIVLGIIGIVAELTLPTLVNNVNNMETVSKLKEVYSILSQAQISIVQDEGGDIRGLYNTYLYAGYSDALFSKLKITKNCSNSANLGCFPSITYNLNKNYGAWGLDSNTGTSYKAILADGVSITTNVAGWNWVNCNFKTQLGNACGSIFVDINGPKLPNVFGKDTFVFWVTTTQIVPAGTSMDFWWPNAGTCSVNSNGYGCAAKVLQEGNMNYLNEARSLSGS